MYIQNNGNLLSNAFVTDCDKSFTRFCIINDWLHDSLQPINDWYYHAPSQILSLDTSNIASNVGFNILTYAWIIRHAEDDKLLNSSSVDITLNIHPLKVINVGSLSTHYFNLFLHTKSPNTPPPPPIVYVWNGLQSFCIF